MSESTGPVAGARPSASSTGGAEPYFSEKAKSRIAKPAYRGMFDASDATEKGLVLVQVKVQMITLYCLFDAESEVLYDARFFSYGTPITTVVADTFLQLSIGKSLEAIKRITPEEVERYLRDASDRPTVEECGLHYFQLVDRLKTGLAGQWSEALAVAEAAGILKKSADGLTAAERMQKKAEAFAARSSIEQRLEVERVLEEYIRPGLAADGGGLILEDIEDGRRVVVTYEGACGSCGISAGATLAFIEGTLRAHLHDRIEVVPTNATAWAV